MRTVPNASTAEVIADRYLTSPAGLRSRPFGPVDALDTHAGRAAQVRVVFLAGEWIEEAVSERVAAWCGIGTAGVIGVLDFGLHDGRAFVILPPSLGVPLERWQAMRRPSAVEAATLALSFGRLIEAVSAAGFGIDVAEPSDFAVGPGPTPFLDIPLLGPAQDGGGRARGDGQAVIAQIFRTTVADPLLPPGISDWVAAAGAAEFDDVAACLDALETAASAAHETADGSEPVGIAGVFDAPVAVPTRQRATRRPRMQSPWVRLALIVLLAVACFSSYRQAVRAGSHRPNSTIGVPETPAATTKTPPASSTPAVTRPAAKRHRHAATHPKRHKARTKRRKTHPKHFVTPTTSTGTTTPTTTPSTPSPSPSHTSPGGDGRVAVGGGSKGGGGGRLPVAVGGGKSGGGGLPVAVG